MKQAQFAMRLSLVFGVIMLLGKSAAYLMTHSVAIFSDAAESVDSRHRGGLCSLQPSAFRASCLPAFLYGYERIAFFSAGFEGALIVVAAITILVESIREWMMGLQLQHVGWGVVLILAAGVLNAGLGYYLIRIGRRTHSLILEADGKHVLTDSWTSIGVVLGLVLVLLTHWKPLDPLVAIAVAINILWSGSRLLWRSAAGLLDYSDPEAGRRIRARLDAICIGLEHSISRRAFQNYGVPALDRGASPLPERDARGRGARAGHSAGRTADGRDRHAGRGDYAP